MGSFIGDLLIHDSPDYGKDARNALALKKNREQLAPDTADMALLAAKRKDAAQLLPGQSRASTFLTASQGAGAGQASTPTTAVAPVLLNPKKPMGGY